MHSEQVSIYLRWKMVEFQTVFEITPGPSAIQMEIYFRLAIGFVALALAVIPLVLRVTRRKTSGWRPKLYTSIFLLVWAVFWLCFTVPWFFIANRELDSLLTAYQTGNYEVVEGPVRVLRTQPEDGHAPGDLVSVAETQFEYSFFHSTHAYHTTIAHGGDLRDGVYARVFHLEGDILRIDVKESTGQQRAAGRPTDGGS